MSPTPSRRLLIPATITAGALALAGCGAFHPEHYPVDGPTLTATANPQEVTADQFGHSWPLTIDHGWVGCELNEDGDPVLNFTDLDGTVYALNALEENRGNADIGELATGSIGPLRTFAFAVCDVDTR
ncbi:hypothetical protein [Microbacterium lacticum]